MHTSPTREGGTNCEGNPLAYRGDWQSRQTVSLACASGYCAMVTGYSAASFLEPRRAALQDDEVSLCLVFEQFPLVGCIAKFFDVPGRPDLAVGMARVDHD